MISPLQKRTGFPRPNPNDNITLDWKTCPARTAHLAAERQEGDGGGAAAQIAVHWERVQVSNVNCTLLRVKAHGLMRDWQLHVLAGNPVHYSVKCGEELENIISHLQSRFRQAAFTCTWLDASKVVEASY